MQDTLVTESLSVSSILADPAFMSITSETRLEYLLRVGKATPRFLQGDMESNGNIVKRNTATLSVSKRLFKKVDNAPNGSNSIHTFYLDELLGAAGTDLPLRRVTAIKFSFLQAKCFSG